MTKAFELTMSDGSTATVYAKDIEAVKQAFTHYDGKQVVAVREGVDTQ